MPAALSMDLRERVVKAYEDKEGCLLELARRFCVGEATVTRWVRRYQRTGSVSPSPHGGGLPPHLPEEKLGAFVQLVEAHNDATLPSLVELCQQQLGVATSTGGVGRALKRAHFTRKKSR